MSSFTKRMSVRIQKWFNEALHIIVLLPAAIYFRGFDKNTRRPILTIIGSQNVDETKVELEKWLRLKTREAQYVQVAGVVIFASTTSCLSWNTLSSAHWFGPALWYATILLAVPSVLLGTQQLSVLPEVEEIRNMSPAQIENMRESFVDPGSNPPKPSRFMLFVWQAPRMFFAYSVACFLAGLFSVVLSPIMVQPGWNNEMKTAVIFLSVAAFTVAGFVMVTFGVHRFTKQ